MILSFVLFFFYLTVFSWLLTKSVFITQTGWSKALIAGLFCLRVLVGVFHTWIFRNYVNSDMWIFHTEGLKESFLLLHRPKEYLLNIFDSAKTAGYNGFFRPENSFWNDLKSNLMIKIDSLFNLISFGNFYINTIFYNFLVFFGIVSLYKLFARIYDTKKTFVLITVMLLPSFLFFGTVCQKEGIISASIGILVYSFDDWLKGYKLSYKRILASVFSLLLIFFLRNYVLVLLLPSMLVWYISTKANKSPLVYFLIVYGTCVVIFFGIHSIFPAINPPKIIVAEQAAFFELPRANSYIEINVLEPELGSFVKNIPIALKNGILRPFIWDSNKAKFLLPFSLEVILYEIVLLIFLIFKEDKPEILNNPFLFQCYIFGFSLLILTGLIVPVLGAILRYRSVYLPFIICPLICGIDWRRVRGILQIEK